MYAGEPRRRHLVDLFEELHMGLFDRRARRPPARPDVAVEYDRDYEPDEHQTMAIALRSAIAARTPAMKAAPAPCSRRRPASGVASTSSTVL